MTGVSGSKGRDRRQLLKRGLGVAAGAALPRVGAPLLAAPAVAGAGAAAAREASALAPRIVDTRVELANAADLPFADIVRHQIAALAAEGAIAHPAAAAALLLDAARGSAPSPDDELRGRCSQAVGAMLSPPWTTDDEFEARVARAITRLARGPADVSRDEADGLLRSLGAPAARLRIKGAGGAAVALQAAQRLMRADQPPITRFAAPRETGALRRLLRWTRHLIRPRVEIIEAYLAIYGAPADRRFGVALSAPTVRLRPEDSVETFACRLEAISALALEFATPIHGLAGCDPWRAAMGLGPDGFEAARVAVAEQGFLGVAIPGPPSARRSGAQRRLDGRAASGADEAALDAEDDPLAMEWARSPGLQRDAARALDQLLDWCAAHGAAVLCDRRLAARPPRGPVDLTDAVYWRETLRGRRGLLIGFAGVGSLESATDAAAIDRFCRVLGPSSGAALVDPGLSAAARRGGDDAAPPIRDRLAALRAHCAAGGRAMFGTDWPFGGAPAALDGDGERLGLFCQETAGSQSAWDALARRSALQWLGLTTPQAPGWRRLEAYYRRHDRDFAAIRALGV